MRVFSITKSLCEYSIMPQVIIECKLDGISLRATYHNGKLLELVTRGDGKIGDDITAHAPYLTNLPQTISMMGEVHVRAEGVMYEADFTAHFKPQGKANARNTVSGLLKGRSTPADLKYVHFVAYKLFGDGAPTTTESDCIRTLRGLGFEVPGLCVLVQDVEMAQQVYTNYDKVGGTRESLPYKTDGLVMTVDEMSVQSRFADQANRPGYATAVKPTPKAAVSKVIGIEWAMGLSGLYTPVALVEPCELDGTTCRRINMFNIDFLETWVHGGYLESVKKNVKGGFGIGATVLIIRTGDVLPYLSDVVTPAILELVSA